MTVNDRFEQLKAEIIGTDLTINSLIEVDELHEQFIKLRKALFFEGIMDFMPHYRGEQKYGWDIKPGLFRPPLNIPDATTAKKLEHLACMEFEQSVATDGQHLLRDIFYYEKYGKEWDLLFQAQHGGIKTSITDWTAIIQSALYFAVEHSSDANIEAADGQLWVMLAPTNYILAHTDENKTKNFYSQDPKTINQYYIINPSTYLDDIDTRLYEKRMFRQKGRFFITPANMCHTAINQEEMLRPYLLRFRIPADKKLEIREELAQRQLTRKYVYVQENEQIEAIAADVNKKVYKDYYTN